MSEAHSPPISLEQLQVENTRLQQEVAQLRESQFPTRFDSRHTSASAVDGTALDRNMLNAFVSNLSHELRTPMHTLLGALYLLADSTLTPDQIQQLEAITASTSLLQSLIYDLLDFSAVHTGHINLSLAPANILDLVEVVIPMCSYSAFDRGVYLCYWVEPGCMLRQYLLDRARVEQIMLHLVSNAIKFSKSGGTVTVNVMPAVEADNSLCLVVSDKGVGMPPTSIADLYRPFGHARQESLKDGLGVGLSVVWRLVEAMNGSISCESTVGEGTSFKVSLPAPLTGLTVSDVSNPFGLSEQDLAVLAHAHVVIMSPDRGSADSWSRLLRLYGARVVTVDTLEEVKAYAQQETVIRNSNNGASSSNSNAMSVSCPTRSSIDLVIMDGYHEIIKHCKPNDKFNEEEGLWCADRNPPIVDVEELNATIRSEVSAICRLLLVFVSSKHRQNSIYAREHPVSLLSLLARLRGDRISCSMRPMRGEPLIPVFEGCLVPTLPLGQNCLEGPTLLTAELSKPFNHRPFLCKVSAQLYRLPMSPGRSPSVISNATVTPQSTFQVHSDDTLSQSPASLQIATPELSTAKSAPTDSSAPPLITRLCDMRIMVVEDNRVNQKLMERFLLKLGCSNILVASSGVECLKLLSQQSGCPEETYTQCILMDISMDPMDGRECTRHIRSELQYQHGRRPVYIIAQTANCTELDRASFRQCGMDDYLPKPISLKSLTDALSRAQLHYNQCR